MKKLILFLVWAMNSNINAADSFNLKRLFDINKMLKNSSEYQKCKTHYVENLGLAKPYYKEICKKSAMKDLLSIFHSNSF